MSSSVPSESSGVRARTLGRALDNRLALAGLELSEVRSRLAGTLAAGGAALLLLQLALVCGLIVLIALTWETSWRIAAPALAGGALLILSLAGGWWVWRQWLDWRPLAETQRQLAEDLELLRQEFSLSDDDDDDDADEPGYGEQDAGPVDFEHPRATAPSPTEGLTPDPDLR